MKSVTSRPRQIGIGLIIFIFAISLFAGINSGPHGAVSAASSTNGGSAAAPTTNRPEMLAVHIFFKDNAERDRLANEWGAEEAATTGGYITVWTDRPTYNRMLAQGLHTEIDQQTSKLLNDVHLFGSDSPNTFYGGFKTVEEMQTFLDLMVTTYPTLAQKVDIGDSWCKIHAPCQPYPSIPASNGYDLWALHITNQAIPGPKPVFWYDAGIHAREIAVPEVAMQYIQYLLSNYNTNADAHWMVDYQDIWVMPMVNPDGHHVVEQGGGGNSPYYQRKNSNNTNGCSVTQPPPNGSANQQGTDNNRNFDFQWNCCGGSSGVSCSQTYHGTGGASDPETLAVENKVRSLIADQRGPNLTDPAPITTTGVYQNMHSNAQLNLYPWGFQTGAAPNGPELANLGAHLSATNANPAGNNYTSCQPPNCLYAVDGDAIDWAYGELGAASFTTEVGGSDFLVPLSYVNGTLWPANQGALLYQAKVARQPYLMAHGPDTANVTATPMTVTQGTPSNLAATINYAWTGNTLAQNVGAAEYYVDTPPWAGGTAIAMGGTYGSSQTVAASATINTTSLAPGRHIIFVRGRGVNNYSGLPTWGPVSAVFLDILFGGPTNTPTPTWTPGGPTATPTNTLTRTPTNTSTPTITPTPCIGPELMQNGGFESGLASWTIDGNNPSPVPSTAQAHSGTGSVLLGTVSGGEPNGDGSLYQTVTVPASGGTLSYWYFPGTVDTIAFDWQDAYVTNSSGTILATIMHVAENDLTWKNVTFNMNPYAGQTVRIKFLVHQDGFGDDTYMYVDDVSLRAPVSCGATSTPTNTPVGPTNTPTNTPVGPTNTPTNTPVGPTNTPTNTPVGPTNTPTNTPTGPTNTPTDTPTGPTNTPTVTPTDCPNPFVDINGNTFYFAIHYLYCRGVVNGIDPTHFNPAGTATRAQFAKVVVLGFGIAPYTPTGQPDFTDVPANYYAFSYIEAGFHAGILGGFTAAQCAAAGAVFPCYLPNLAITRGQVTKLVVSAAHYALVTPVGGGQTYSDVPPSNVFYLYVETAHYKNVVNGFPDGTFRPNANIQRDQMCQIVYKGVTTP